MMEGDTIVLPEGSFIRTKINTGTVKSEPYRKQTISTGTVRAIPNNFAHIAAPFSGRITKSFVRLGQRVSVGSPIFEISSPDFLEACKTCFQARQEMQLAEKNLNRQRDLKANGVGVQKELEEAEVAYELSLRNHENATASLSVYNANQEVIALGQPLIVRSPINGEIVENTIVIGQYMRDDSDPVAIVAELSKVWVVGQVKEKDLNRAIESGEVEVILPRSEEVSITGKVYHISEMLDEETRSVQVYIECENRDRAMKPGMYVTVKFFNTVEDAILIPSGAVLQMENGSFVFVEVMENKYVRREIEITGSENGRVMVGSGLKSGDKIVTGGGLLLVEAY